MHFINAVFNTLFDILFSLTCGLGPQGQLLIVSVLTGLMMLLIFKGVSHQEKIRSAKNRIKGHLLELRLYNNDVGLSMRALVDVLASNGLYLVHALRPMLVLMLSTS